MSNQEFPCRKKYHEVLHFSIGNSWLDIGYWIVVSPTRLEKNKTRFLPGQNRIDKHRPNIRS